MDISVQTGQTKATGGAKLVAETLTSAKGEHVIFLLQIQAHSSEGRTLEKECMDVVRTALLETEGEAAERLDGTLKELNGLFKGLLIAQNIEDVHAILGIVDQSNVLHVSHAGRAEAYVVRGGTASQITEYTRGKPTPAFIHIASGPLEPRDIVILSTQRLLRTFTPAQLSQRAHKEDGFLDELKASLESEKEVAALGVLRAGGAARKADEPAAPAATPQRRRQTGQRASTSDRMNGIVQQLTSSLRRFAPSARMLGGLRQRSNAFVMDLKDPERKRRAHFLLLAGILVVFLFVWAVINLSTYSQRSKTRTELEQLITEIESDIRTAENRHLTGELDSANAILQRAEDRAKQVMDNENKLFRSEALDLLSRIRTKREEINNIVRLPPRTVVNLSSKNPDVIAVGFVEVGDGEFIAYDYQDMYRVVLNSVDNAVRLSDDELVLFATPFERYKTIVFQTNGNSVIELINNQPTTMKTEDPAGWITGQDIEAYLRFLYVLSAENNQIYKYERFSNRYAVPSEYNVNADLTGALDMAIDGNVYILKEGGNVLKIFRGEQQQFVIRNLPGAILDGATRIYKQPDGNMYFLDPEDRRIVVVTDGGATGESTYLRQFVLEGEEIGTPKDFYVDPDEARLYVLDEKRLYVIDLANE